MVAFIHYRLLLVVGLKFIPVWMVDCISSLLFLWFFVSSWGPECLYTNVGAVVCACDDGLGFLMLGGEESFRLGEAGLLVKAVTNRNAWVSKECQQQFHVFLAVITLFRIFKFVWYSAVDVSEVFETWRRKSGNIKNWEKKGNRKHRVENCKAEEKEKTNVWGIWNIKKYLFNLLCIGKGKMKLN